MRNIDLKLNDSIYIPDITIKDGYLSYKIKGLSYLVDNVIRVDTKFRSFYGRPSESKLMKEAHLLNDMSEIHAFINVSEAQHYSMKKGKEKIATIRKEIKNLYDDINKIKENIGLNEQF